MEHNRKSIAQLARELRNNPTPAEKRLWKYLRKRRLGGYRFVRQKPFVYKQRQTRRYFFIADYIRRGEAYSDDYISLRFGIGGVFQSEDDQFDPARHEVLVSVVLKEAITEAASEISLRKVDGRPIAAEFDTVYDWGSGTNDEILTPGDVLEITGNHLKIQDNIDEKGVYFVNQSDDTEAKAEQIRTNEPKTLTLRIPEGLAAGTYRIEVRNTARNGNQLRTGIFSPQLTIE